MLDVRPGGGCIKCQVDIGDQVQQPGEPAVGDGMAVLPGQAHAVRIWVDACHPGQLEPGAALDLEHQVGPDVSGADDGYPQARVVTAHAICLLSLSFLGVHWMPRAPCRHRSAGMRARYACRQGFAASGDAGRGTQPECR